MVLTLPPSKLRVIGGGASRHEVMGNDGPSVPAAPTGFLVSSVNDGSLTLSWDAAAGVTWRLYRSSNSGSNYSQVGGDLGIVGVTDTDVFNDNTYYYVLTAVNEAGESAYSAEISGTPTSGETPPPPPETPQPPTGLSVASIGNETVGLSWDAVTGVTWNIYGSTSPGGSYSLFFSGATSNSYSVGSLTNDIVYYFVITAVNGAGESGYSSEVSGTPTII